MEAAYSLVSCRNTLQQRDLMVTPNREPQEYSRNVLEHKDPGNPYIPIIFLLYSWGSLFGVPIKVPLYKFCALNRWGF